MSLTMEVVTEDDPALGNLSIPRDTLKSEEGNGKGRMGMNGFLCRSPVQLERLLVCLGGQVVGCEPVSQRTFECPEFTLGRQVANRASIPPAPATKPRGRLGRNRWNGPREAPPCAPRVSPGYAR